MPTGVSLPRSVWRAGGAPVVILVGRYSTAILTARHIRNAGTCSPYMFASSQQLPRFGSQTLVEDVDKISLFG